MKRVFPVASLFLLLCFSQACGDSAEKKAAEETLAKVRQQMEQLEAELSAEDTNGLEIIEACREKLILANRRLVEGDASKASGILSEIENQLSQLKGMVKGAKRSKTFDVHGLVRFAGSDGELKRLEDNQKLSSVKSLKVGGRSALFLQLFKSVTLNLPAQSEMEILAVDENAKRFQCRLGVGELIINKPNDGSVVEVEMNDYNFIANEECIAEFRFLPLVDSVYVAVLEGNLRWQGAGGSGVLFKYDGFFWKGLDSVLTQTPIVPTIDEPTNESKIAMDPTTGEAEVYFRWHTKVFVANYQLQVSDSALFVTRIFDDSRLTRGQAAVVLPKGSYFWRVRSISNEGIPGPFSETMELHVGAYEAQGDSSVVTTEKKNVSGPKISKLDYNLIGMTVIVSGKTNPGVRVNVSGVAAVQDEDGSFKAIVNFDHSGEHMLRILARDPVTGGETILDKKIKIAE